MEIREFDHDIHSEFLREWLDMRDMEDSVVDRLPSCGFIAYEGDTPVACAFLRYVEGGWAICDGLCTNPMVPGETRSIANDVLIQQLIDKAKETKITALIAWTDDDNTLDRSIRHGFNRVPSTLITYDLSRG